MRTAVLGFTNMGTFEARRHILTDLVAAGPNAWADRRLQILRTASKRCAEFLDRFRTDAGSGPSPTRMHCRHGPCARIKQQNRDAICSTNANRPTHFVRNKCVAFPLAVAKITCNANIRGVDLPQRQGRKGSAYARLKSVFLPFVSVPCRTQQKTNKNTKFHDQRETVASFRACLY